MLKCGEYTLDRQIGWGRSATYYTAYSGDDAGDTRLVVRRSRYTDRPHVLAFLRSAAEQQTAIMSGCRRVAPVLDFGVAESGHAYRVNLGYEVSLAECIQAGNSIDHDHLRAIVSGTLRALTELRDKFKRPHGNLSAGNILLDRDGEVLLTDLAPTALEATHSGDLQAFGAIIYQLVRQSLRIGFLSPPLESSPEWSNSLGDHADDWREFTNRLLLTKKGEGAASLERAVNELKHLGTLAETVAPLPVAATPSGISSPQAPSVLTPLGERRRSKARKRMALAAALFVTAGGIAAYIFLKPPPAPEKLDVKPLPAIGVRELQALIAPDWEGKLGEGRSLVAYIRRAGSVEEVKTRMQEWIITDRLAKIGNEWISPSRNWGKLAELLATDARLDSSEGTEEEMGERLAAALRDVPRAATLLTAAQEVDRQWKRLEETCARIEGLKVGGLPNFTEWAQAEVGNSAKLAEASSKCAAADSALRELEVSARLNAARVRQDIFLAEAKKIPNLASADMTWPKKWQTALESALKPTPETVAGWTKDFEVLKKRIAARPGEEQSDWTKKLEAIQRAADNALVGTASAVDDQIRQLRDQIRDPVEDLDTAFRQAFSQFLERVKVAPDRDSTFAVLNGFSKVVTPLATKPEFADAWPKLLAFYGIAKPSALLSDFAKAANVPDKPIYSFAPTTAGQWVPVQEGQTSSTYIFQGRARSEPITFHIIPGSPSAIAAVETPLGLAESVAGLERPPPDGPLGNRDTKRGNFDQWWWKAADDWAKIVTERSAGDPKAILRSPAVAEIVRCPVTWISFQNATRVAAALGTRLPTATEWKNALAAFPQTRARLRGQALTTAEAAIRAAQANKNTPPLPLWTSAVSFQGYPAPADYVATLDAERPYIWIGPSVNRPGEVADLIGNASEWIQADSGGLAGLAGGSCLTLVNSAVKLPQPAARPSYCDVTFRMVVGVVPGSGTAGRDALLKVALAEWAKFEKKKIQDR